MEIGDVASKSTAKDVASVRDLGKLEIETCICSFLLFEIRLSFSCSNFRLLGDAGTAGEGEDVAISGYWAFGNEAADGSSAPLLFLRTGMPPPRLNLVLQSLLD
ncbi:hypothetical protein L2E82_50187 [Cichorium intybus]|nr:hypothetical protein L2E82_50187 [Cichorium intybus]